MVVDQEMDSAQASHTYSDPGQYTIRVTVIDDDGASVEAEIEVSVQLVVQEGLIFLPLVSR
jgi:PKD repeat protein